MTGESYQRRRYARFKDLHHSISKEPVFWNGITAVRPRVPFSSAAHTPPLAR
jgi:hypothetical protein